MSSRKGLEWLSPDDCPCSFDLGDGGDGSEVHGRPPGTFTVNGIVYDIDDAEGRVATDIQPMITMKDDMYGCADHRSSEVSLAHYQRSWHGLSLEWTPDDSP